jgi:hypothetical protein
VVVHLLGADLDLDRFAGLAIDHLAHYRVERLVPVGLRPRDVVVKLLVDRLEVRMHPGQRAVAVLDVGHHHAQGQDVEHLPEVERLATHLLHDAVDVLRPALDRRADALALQFMFELAA